MCVSGRSATEVFKKNGDLRNIHRLRPWALPDVLREKYHFSVDEAKRISDFLLPMLELEPSKRANAGGMAAGPFMDATPGMDGITIPNIEYGSRGEGIEGWATEIKKR